MPKKGPVIIASLGLLAAASGSVGAQTAPTTHAGKETKVILQGVDRYRVTEPLFEGVRVVLSYRGDKYSPAYIQGISGAAFRLSGMCPSGPTCCSAMEPKELIKLLGYSSEELPLGVEGKDPKVRVYEVLDSIKAEIRAGRPALLWHAFTNAEIDVVCGFDETEKQLFGRGSYVGLNDYARAPEARTLSSEKICGLLSAILIGEKTGTFNRRAAERATLEEAVRHAHSQAGVDLLAKQPDAQLEGLACYERWQREFLTDPSRKRTNGDSYCLGIYRSTHRAAGDFLKEIAPSWPKASPHLLAAAEQFTLESDALDQCWPLLGWKAPEGPDLERNRKAGALLKTAYEHYAQGIAEIEKALPLDDGRADSLGPCCDRQEGIGMSLETREIFVRIIELPRVRMARSGSGDLSAFDRWWSTLASNDKSCLFPKDFLWFNPALNHFEWLYALPEGLEDTGGYEVFDFPGGLYAVAACRDEGSEIKGTNNLIHQWVAQSEVFAEAPQNNGIDIRYDMGHIITPANAKEIMGYHQMDLFVPIVYKNRQE